MTQHQRVDAWLEVSRLKYHLNIWDGGGETTVLLLHGFLDLGQSWSFFVEQLPTNDLHIIAPDWRGHGDSEWIGRGGYYHFTDYVRDLHQIAQAVRRSRLVVVGHSMGAMVSSLWAGTPGVSLDELVLVEGVGPPPITEKLYPGRFARWLEQTAPFHGQEWERPMSDLAHAQRRLQRAFPNFSADILNRLAEMSTRILDDGSVRWKYDPLLKTTSPMPTLPTIAAELWKNVKCVVRRVEGERSQFKGRSVDAWFAHHAQIDHKVLKNTGHMVHNEAPKALAKMMSPWLFSG